MLKISNLSVKYNTNLIIDNLNIVLSDNEILMLVGPTGCGKTTVLRAIAGLVPIHTGRIEFDHWYATPNNRITPEKRNLGMVFQDFALFPHLTAEQNISFRLNSSEQADYWIELLGLEKFRKSKPNDLSGGQKQRVALARTLAHQPKLVLLDEPLSNLDAALKDDLRWEIRTALKEANIPAIWVTHDQEEALSVGDRIGVLRTGKLEQLDTPETCFNQPANKFVARFLGEANFLPGNLEPNSQTIETALGKIKSTSAIPKTTEIELMIRPSDLSLSSASPTNGRIIETRYEGETRFYKVQLSSGTVLSVRTNHQNHFAIDQQVLVTLTTDSPVTF